MKKCLLVISVVICFLVGNKNADAGIYIYGNGGGGGEADAPSIGGDFGYIWPKDNQVYLLGMGFSWTHTEKSEPATIFLDKVRDNELEWYGVAGINITKGLFITGTGGVTETCEGLVFKGESPSACVATDGTDVKNLFTWSGQLRYVKGLLVIGAGYHNRRGIIAGIGFNF